jgi:hypothetical protein
MASTWTCALDGVSNESGALAALEASLAPYGTNDYLRVRLSGNVEMGTRIDADLMGERFGASLGSLTVADATVSHDYAAIAREPTVRGHVVSDLLARGEEGAAALRYALAAFDGTEIAP